MQTLTSFLSILFISLFYSYIGAADNITEADVQYEDESESIFSPVRLYTWHDDIGNTSRKVSPAPNEFYCTLTSTLDEPVKYKINLDGDNASYFLIADIDEDSDKDSIPSCLTKVGKEQREFAKDELCMVRVLFGGDNITEKTPTAGDKTASLIVSYVGNTDPALEYKFSGRVIEVADVNYQAVPNYDNNSNYITNINSFGDVNIGKRSRVPFIWVDSRDIDISENLADDLKYKLIFQDGFFDSFGINRDETTCVIDNKYNLTISDEPCYIFIYFTPKTEGKVSKKFVVEATNIINGETNIIVSEILTGVGVKK